MPNPQGRSFPMQTAHENGLTRDIINAVVAQLKKAWRDTAALAPSFRAATDEQTLRNVWAFARHQITYVLDQPAGTQWIKTPRAVVSTGFCDCKGLATLQNSILLNLGYKPAFKFVSYVPGGEATHVYTQVDAGGKTYILDACMYDFNIEKPYAGAELVPAQTA
jgi:hypothetical protein